MSDIIKLGQFWFVFFEKIGLYDVYHSVWFLTILLFLVLSTTLCIIKNTPAILKDFSVFKDSLEEKSLLSFTHHLVIKNKKYVNTSKILHYFLLFSSFSFSYLSISTTSKILSKSSPKYSFNTFKKFYKKTIRNIWKISGWNI